MLTISNTILYSKGWYKRYHIKSSRKTIWHDLRKTLNADGYFMDLDNEITKHDIERIAFLIVKQFDLLPKTGSSRSLTSFYEGIKEHNCWKYGYYTKNNCSWFDTSEYPEYDYNEAVVKYCLSNFSMLESKEWQLTFPDKSVLPLSNGVTLKKLKYHFSII